jgi:hypothetical protein
MRFSAEWLALRERYDQLARNKPVLDALAAAFRQQTSIAVVDLACGTSAMLRAISGYLPARQHWRLVDNDLGLLAKAGALAQPPQLMVATTPMDLARDLELALDGPVDLVTASALLDLVSLEWLDRLILETATRRLPIYAALSYDGRVIAEPSVPFDAEMVAGFNKHQLTDKGFGRALGPGAAARAIERFERTGYRVVQGRSDWVLGAHDPVLQEKLFAGWAELAPLSTGLSSSQIAQWLGARRNHIAIGRSRLRIGHMDLFARPMGTR